MIESIQFSPPFLRNSRVQSRSRLPPIFQTCFRDNTYVKYFYIFYYDVFVRGARSSAIYRFLPSTIRGTSRVRERVSASRGKIARVASVSKQQTPLLQRVHCRREVPLSNSSATGPEMFFGRTHKTGRRFSRHLKPRRRRGGRGRGGRVGARKDNAYIRRMCEQTLPRYT